MLLDYIYNFCIIHLTTEIFCTTFGSFRQVEKMPFSSSLQCFSKFVPFVICDLITCETKYIQMINCTYLSDYLLFILQYEHLGVTDVYKSK